MRIRLLAVLAGLGSLAFPMAARAQRSWSTAAKLDLPGGLPMQVVACPSATQCTTVDDARDAMTFNPHIPGVSPTVRVPGTGSVVAIACGSPGECTAVLAGAGSSAGRAVTFDPITGAQLAPAIALASFGEIACSSATQCTVVDANDGEETTFDPGLAPRRRHRSPVSAWSQSSVHRRASAPRWTTTSTRSPSTRGLPARGCVSISRASSLKESRAPARRNARWPPMARTQVVGGRSRSIRGPHNIR